MRTSPDDQHWNRIDYILCSQRWRSSIQSAKIRTGADCGSDHEFLIAKFRLKLKKVGKTTRPFTYDLNQIPVEVRNRFKALDLINRMPDELQTEFRDTVQETGINTIPKKKKCKKAKWLSEWALQIAVKRREGKSKLDKERYTHLNAEFQRIARRDKRAFQSNQCKEIEENNRMGKTRDLFMEKAVAPDSSTLAWKIPWTEEPGRLRSIGSLSVGHDWVTSRSLFTLMHWRRK